MAYQSYYSGNQTAAPAKTKTGGYQSFYGNSVQQAPSAAELATRRKKRKDEEQQVQAKKAEAPKPKPQSFLTKAKNVVNDNLVKPVVSTGEKSANTLAAGYTGVAGAGKAIAQTATGDKKGAQKTAESANKRVDSLLTKGAGGKGGFLTPEQASARGGGTKSLKKDFLKPTAKAAAEVAPLVTPIKGAKGATLLARTAKNAAANAGVGAASVAASEAADTGHVSGKNVAKGAAFGAALGTAGELAHGGIKVASKPVQKVLEQQRNINTLIDKARANTALTMARRDQEVAAATTTKPPELVALENSSAQKIAAADRAIGKNDRIFEKKAPGETDAQFAHRYMRENPEQVAKDYADRTRQEFGNAKDNIVSGDEAKFIIPDFGPKKSVPYHEAASKYAKQHYAKLLKDPTTKDRHILITAGGSGAGKTSSLREFMESEGNSLDHFAAVVDTNLGDMKGATSRIEAALASGRKVDINYTYRHPDEAYMDGVVPRAARTGRVVTPAIHDSTHTGSVKTIFELAEKYKDDPRVDINILDNSRGRGNQTIVPIDFLKDKAYNKGEVEQRTNKLLDEALSNKKLTQEQVNELRGSSETPSPEGSRPSVSRSNETPKQSSTDGSTKPTTEHAKKQLEAANKESVSRVYERLRADHPHELGDELNYDSINLKDQAEKAVKLIGEDKQKAYRIATGQEVSPESTATSVNIALAEKALDEGNTDLYATLIRNRSLAQTRRGQELVSEKASINDNSTSRYVKELLGQRLTALGKKNTFGIDLKRNPKQVATAAIDREVKKLDMQIRNRKLDPKTALALLDKMECI